MDEYVSKLIAEVAANKDAESFAACTEAEQKDAEAIAYVQALLPKELHQYVTILDGDTVLLAPECGPIQVTNARWKYDTKPIIRHVVRRSAQYGDGPTWSDEWCEAYLDLGEALYHANLQYQRMQKLTAEWEAEQAAEAKRPDYLRWAIEAPSAEDAQARALIGILEYLQNRG